MRFLPLFLRCRGRSACVIGTYSSIYIAAAALLMFGLSGKDMAVIKKEGEGFGKV